MPSFSAPTTRLLPKIHRWGGLLVVGFIIFYCVTGLLLNHRKDFTYFQTKTTETKNVPVSDLTLLHSFISTYKNQINRTDDPKVIRIKDGSTIEFLYGSHGKTTYVITPKEGHMDIIQKEEIQPWNWLNNLHKTWKTSSNWLFLTDIITVVIFLTTVTGTLMLRYRPLDILLTSSSFILLALGAFFAC